jgi:release factor glutamine methyltransferase
LRVTVNMTVAEHLAAGVAALRQASAGAAQPQSADLDARLLLAHALTVPKAQLTSRPDAPVSVPEAERYRALLARRLSGEPVAYLTGEKEFWSLRLRVTPAVLVPRPETELLVERALALGPKSTARAADLGTGSGAIALALAYERPQWQVTATDICEAALEAARANAAALGLTRIVFRHGSWLEALTPGQYDLIVSNPPYVAADDPALKALTHEPAAALTPGVNGLAALFSIVAAAPPYLAPGGWLLLEHGATQGEAVRHALVQAGMRSVRSHTDLAGHERMTEGQQ